MIGFLSVMAMLASCVAFVIGLITVAYPLKRIGLRKRWHGAILSVGAFALFMISGFGLPEATPVSKESETVVDQAEAAPKSLVDADRSIRSVTLSGDELVIDLFIADAWLDSDYIDYAGWALKKIAQAMQRRPEEAMAAKAVRLDVSGTATDRLGRETESAVFTATFVADDFRQANTDNLNSGRMLNLAEKASFSLAGSTARHKWCAKGDNFADARSFCLSGS